MVKNGIYSSFGGFSMGKPLLPVRSVGTPEIYHSSTGRRLPIKQARIVPKKPKEELRPFYTNFATG
jgi:hypothetical protein